PLAPQEPAIAIEIDGIFVSLFHMGLSKEKCVCRCVGREFDCSRFDGKYVLVDELIPSLRGCVGALCRAARPMAKKCFRVVFHLILRSPYSKLTGRCTGLKLLSACRGSVAGGLYHIEISVVALT